MRASALHNAGGWLARRAATTGERVAIVEAERTLGYAALEERSARCAAYARRARRRRAATASRSRSPIAPPSSRPSSRPRGSARSRCRINTRLAPPELREILDDAEPRVLLHEASLHERIERACDGARSAPLRLAVGGDPDAYEAALAGVAPHLEIAARDARRSRCC